MRYKTVLLPVSFLHHFRFWKCQKGLKIAIAILRENMNTLIGTANRQRLKTISKNNLSGITIVVTPLWRWTLTLHLSCQNSILCSQLLHEVSWYSFSETFSIIFCHSYLDRCENYPCRCVESRLKFGTIEISMLSINEKTPNQWNINFSWTRFVTESWCQYLKPLCAANDIYKKKICM